MAAGGRFLSAIAFIYSPHERKEFVRAKVFPYNWTNFTFPIPEGGAPMAPPFSAPGTRPGIPPIDSSCAVYASEADAHEK